MAFNSLSSLVIYLCLFSSLLLVVSGYEYGPTPKVEKPTTYEKPKTHENLLPEILRIQGLIYCKSGPKLIPLKGAVARITCLAVDQNGYQSAPISILSHPCDSKGYFLATLSHSKQLEDSLKLAECKAFLENSPLETCNVPTDINNGMSGSLLSSHKLLNNIKLYSVGPFFYTSEPKPVSNGY